MIKGIDSKINFFFYLKTYYPIQRKSTLRFKRVESVPLNDDFISDAIKYLLGLQFRLLSSKLVR